jgi:hypothetical protein
MPLIKFYKQAASKLNKRQVTLLEILYTTRNTPIPVTATTWSQVVIEKLNAGQVVEKSPKLYSIRRYIAGSQELATPHPPLPILRQMKPLHNLPLTSVMALLSIILLSCRSSRRVSFLQAFRRNPL